MPKEPTATDGDVGKTENCATRQMKTATRGHGKRELGQGNTGKIHGNMDKSRRKHKEANRLHRDQCQIQGYGKESAKKYLMARKYEPESTAPGANNKAAPQRRKEVQETNYRVFNKQN